MMISRISFILGIGVIASVGVLLLAQTSAPGIEQLGPQVGDTVSDFSLVDQTGLARDLRSILGPNGALLVFNRSADW